MRHLGHTGALDGYQLTLMDIVATSKGSGEAWWRIGGDRNGDRRLEASAVDETPHGLVFEFCEAGGPRHLRLMYNVY